VEEDLLRMLRRSLLPAPTQVVGRLLAVSANDSFSLVLPDGSEVIGGTRPGFPLTQLARLIGLEVEVYGTGLYAPSKRLMFFLADGLLPHNSIQPESGRLPGELPEVRTAMAERLRGVIGLWPGAQTDEQETPTVGERN